MPKELTAHWIVLALGAYAVIVGATTLVGWFAGLPRFTDWTASGMSMFPNAAFTALCSGAALMLATQNRPSLSLVGGFLGGVVLLLAGATLFQYVSGADLGVDTFLIETEWGTTAAMVPGRMRPPTSSCYALIGLALVLMASGRARRLVPALGIGAGAIAAFALLGSAFGADLLFAVARLTGIAVQTSSVLVALAVGVVASVPEYEPMRTLRQDSAAGVLARRCLPFIVVLPFLLGWLRVRGQLAGWFDTATGTALFTLALTAMFSALLWWWVSAIAKYEDELRRSQIAESSRRAQLETLIDRAPLGVYLIDADFRIAQVNPVALPVFGAIPGGVIERDLSEIIHLLWEKTYAEQLVRIFRHTLETGEPYVAAERAKYRIDRKETEYYEWRLDRIALPDGRNGLVCYFRDISKQIEAERERARLLESERAARREAEQANRLKDEFLATLSHELRTPLNAILGWGRLIDMHPGDQGIINKGAEVITRNAKAQADLIADLLDMSRIVSGKLHLEVEDVDLAEVIANAIETVRHGAQAKRIRIERTLAPISDAVRGDAGRLQQVVWNLLSNAVKFTPHGGRIGVVLAEKHSHAEIVVSDTGMGIETGFLPHIFERFRQADASTSRVYGGLGLGLAIVKHLVELHGGTVRVRSREGQGAVFTVRLPLASMHGTSEVTEGTRDQRREESRPAVHDDIDLNGLRVLAIDDQADSRELIGRLVEESHGEVILASSADEGLRVVKDQRPDVVLCDIGMPGKDGYEFIREMHDQGSDIPALAVTAFARGEDRLRAIRAGYQGHLTKPLAPADFVAAIAAFADARRGGRTNAERAKADSGQ